MIKYLSNSEINKQRWDDCIKNAVNGIVYANSWYLDIVADGWSALVENDYERVFPLVSGQKYGIQYLFQPVFTQQLGVFSKTILTEQVVTKFLDAIPQQFKFAEINLNAYNKLPPGKYRSVEWINHELDLINAYNKIFKGFSINLKRKIKKAEQAELTVLSTIKPEEVIGIFQENKGKELKHLQEVDYQKLRRLAYMGIYKGLVMNYGVYSPKNELCAGAIFIRSKHKIIFLFSGLTAEGRELNAMALLISSVIKDHSQHHITLDFEGSNDPDLARFYKSFGSTTSTYPHLQINKLPIFIKFAVRIAKTFR